MLERDFLDPYQYKITAKRSASGRQVRKLSDAQVGALRELSVHQGDLAAISTKARRDLGTLQARIATDPNIAGNAALIDFSIRTVSIHKTWSWFKNFKSSGPFDPETLPRVDLSLGDLVRRR